MHGILVRESTVAVGIQDTRGREAQGEISPFPMFHREKRNTEHEKVLAEIYLS